MSEIGELAGVVLAAGQGKRLRPLTAVRPKALCTVAGRTLLDGALTRLAPYVARTAVNAHHHADQIVAALAGRDVHIEVERPVALGTAGALGNLRGWLAGDAVLLTNADACHPGDDDPLDLLLDGWDGQRPRLLCARTGLRQDFGGLQYVGSAALPWWSVRDLPATPAGLYEVSWRQLYAEGRLDVVESPGPAVDCGTPADYLRANMLASGGRAGRRARRGRRGRAGAVGRLVGGDSGRGRAAGRCHPWRRRDAAAARERVSNTVPG